jgi:hypothetical protein
MQRRAGLLVAKKIRGKNNIKLKSNRHKTKFFPLFFLTVFSFAINDGILSLALYLEPVLSALNVENHNNQFLLFPAEIRKYESDTDEDYAKLIANSQSEHIAHAAALVHPSQTGTCKNIPCFLPPPRSPPCMRL